jgi:2-keto-3-deoxy-L-rhamnonate aldolase RhmA
MKYIRDRVLNGQLVSGTWCMLGSTLTVELAGSAGLDWILIDLEHGYADLETLLHQLQAAAATPAVPIVRIPWNEAHRFKRILDMGASGVMVPFINNAKQADIAAKSTRYPPHGIRGLSTASRASDFGRNFDHYFAHANDTLLTVVQIESEEAVKNANEIAAVDGIDVLFVGPADLSTNMGIPLQLDHPDFQRALKTIVSACKNAGKAAGILLGKHEQIAPAVEAGFTFIALSTDITVVANGMKNIAAALNKFK